MKTEPHVIRRILAAGVDYLLFFGLAWAYVITFGRPAEDGSYHAEGCGDVLIIMGVWFILLPLIEGIAGFTLGKGLLGLQVVDLKCRKVSMPKALLRHLFDFVDFSAGGLVGILLLFFTPNHQRIGDFVAKTKVISDAEAKALKTVGDVFT